MPAAGAPRPPPHDVALLALVRRRCTPTGHLFSVSVEICPSKPWSLSPTPMHPQLCTLNPEPGVQGSGFRVQS